MDLLKSKSALEGKTMKEGLQYGRNSRKGIALVAALFFVVIFSAISVGLFTMSANAVQVSSNHHKANHALNAAMSGLECAQYLVSKMATFETGINYVTDEQANTIWTNLCAAVQDEQIGGLSVPSAGEFEDAGGCGDQIVTQLLPYSDTGAQFQVRFFRYSSDPRTIYVQCSGQDSGITRKVGINMTITKDAEVLQYAIAGRGRMWITGDTTIYGDIYSSWDRADISPFNMTDDSRVEGTINTVLSKDQIDAQSYDMETTDSYDNALFDYGISVYDAAGNPIGDSYGPANEQGYMCYVDEFGELQPVYDTDGLLIPVDYSNRVYSSSDEIQGYHENINYSQPAQDDIPGLDISDYNTDMYQDYVLNEGNGDIPSSSTVEVEYFPHAAGDYNTPQSSSSRKLNRQVYENMTFTNVRLPSNRNALFRNCTFEEILYVDCYKSTSSYYNNVRFEDCNFNGVIVTDTPSALKWQYNALYFTGSANFNNQSSIQEATILAPHFNVNLGDANNGDVESDDENVITGAVVGGIVDVRGNAQIYGTIISMCDTTAWSSGYVTNIGATLDDGGSETTSIEDIGTIEITPDQEQMLPSGITTPVILKPVSNSYTESI